MAVQLPQLTIAERIWLNQLSDTVAKMAMLVDTIGASSLGTTHPVYREAKLKASVITLQKLQQIVSKE